jgi:hypothetical protein
MNEFWAIIEVGLASLFYLGAVVYLWRVHILLGLLGLFTIPSACLFTFFLLAALAEFMSNKYSSNKVTKGGNSSKLRKVISGIPPGCSVYVNVLPAEIMDIATDHFEACIITARPPMILEVPYLSINEIHEGNLTTTIHADISRGVHIKG